MKTDKIIYTLLILVLGISVFNCGGKYEPEFIPTPVRIAESPPKERMADPKTEPAETPSDKERPRTITPEKNRTDNIYQKGIASWYGGKFQGRRTANGEVYDKYKLTAAHKTLPFNSIVRVTNRLNNKTVIVRINDRGPFVKNRIIDLSKKAARLIDMEDTGTAPVALEILNKTALNKIHRTPVFSENRVSRGNTTLSDTDDNDPEPVQWFYIQAGAFRDRINAERILSKIKRVTEVKFMVKESNDFYRVISVKLSPRSFAEKISEDLKEYYIDTFVKSF